MNNDDLNLVSKEILDASVAVHKEMGPGLLESVYQQCLVKELSLRGIKTEVLVPVALQYKGYTLNKDYVIDILVEEEIILELKAVETILPVHEAQIISYLKLADKRLGFLINFNVRLMKDGFRRFVNNF
ncbi:MAG: GxxExxY protein [Bacteroidetes bacterium CHB5]|nr:GxxExxY protein [Bacteroidetes bacterium CHB5]